MSPERQQTVCACEASIALGVTPLSPFCLPSHRAELVLATRGDVAGGRPKETRLFPLTQPGWASRLSFV